jgi:cellulose synthase/poly-beta-1,6-N-acetylglucosamine synthase-like glycosyltransferase
MLVFTIFLIVSLFILIGGIAIMLFFPKFEKPSSQNSGDLGLSVIISFKDEEYNLENLFSNLKKLNYPKDKFEVILVDDGSTDNSYHTALKLVNRHDNYRVIKAHMKRFPGKKGALEVGIRNSKFPFILITDADCIPTKDWLLGYAEKFNEKYDFLFGLAPLIQTNGLINKISCFDNLRSTVLTFTSTNLGIPYSAASRNFGFSKSAFEKLGSFSNTMQTLSGDDDLLLREAIKQKMKIGIVDTQESFVLTNSKSKLRDYLQQKARHTKTSLYYLPKHQFLLGFWHLANILILCSPLFGFMNILFMIPFLIKIITDLILVVHLQDRLFYKFKLIEIALLQLIYELFLVVNFIGSFRKNIPWKS